MKVSELFAEIGFKVDTKGLDEFSKSLKNISETIKQSVSGLKQFAQQADQIARAAERLRSSYAPSEKELASRYRAQTSYIRAVASEMRGNASKSRGLGKYWSKRANWVDDDAIRLMGLYQLRKEQWEAKKSGLYRRTPAEGESYGWFSNFSSTLSAIIVSAIPKGMAKGYAAVKNFVSDTVAKAISYRDYMTYTGRSPKELGSMFARAFNATDLSAQDVMNTAKGFEKGFWDIWLGRKSPAAFHLLGLMPTGNGAQDMTNFLMAVAKLPHKGLQASMLGIEGLDSKWMQVVQDIQTGKPYKDVFQLVDADFKAAERMNQTINSFTDALNQAKIKILEVLVNEGGLSDILNGFVEGLRDMLAIMNTPEFRNANLAEKLKMLLFTDTSTRVFHTGNGSIIFDERNVSKTEAAIKGILGGMLGSVAGVAGGSLGGFLGSFAGGPVGGIAGGGALGGLSAWGAYNSLQPNDWGLKQGYQVINIGVSSAEEAGRVVNELSSGSSVDQVELNYTNAAGRSFWSR